MSSESLHLWPAAAAAEGTRSSIWTGLVQRPWQLLALLCLAQTLCWTIMPAIVNIGPPRDVVEGFMWGREWVLLTYKHPQLPCWLLEIGHLVTGSTRWPQYLISQLMISTTFVLVYCLARDIMGSTRALAAVLLMPSIYFFGWPTPQFNHDYAQMPFWAGICWLLWRAARDGRPGWWLALGLVAGVGLYAKFSTGLLLLFGATWILYDPRARSRLATPWPWLGLAVFLGVAAPLAIALYRFDFMPLTYAEHRDAWVLAHRARLYYIGVQLAGLSAFLVVLGLSGLLRQLKQSELVRLSYPAVERRAVIYLAWMGLGPALLVMIASLFTGTGESWGATMYNLVGAVAIALLGERLGMTELRRLAVLALVCIVGVAMLAGLNAPDEPSIFTDLDRRLAPWITDKRLHDQGMLLVWLRDATPPPRLRAWIAGLPVKTAFFNWSLREPPIAVNFAVLPPGRSNLPGDSAQAPDPE